MSDVKGLLPLDPPPGGLPRLRSALHVAEAEGRWLPLLPWMTAAVLLVAILGVSQRAGADLTARIVEEVREQDPGEWTVLPGGRDGVHIYLAHPARAGTPESAPPPTSL